MPYSSGVLRRAEYSLAAGARVYRARRCRRSKSGHRESKFVKRFFADLDPWGAASAGGILPAL